MTREYGQEFPERPLMATLSDLLGIPHFTTSRGSTVRRDFLVAVADALALDPGTVAAADKDGLIRLVWEAAQGTRMPADRLSIGGTVTNKALQEIVDGILERGIPGRLEGSAKIAAEPLGEEEYEGFDPTDLADERDRHLVEIARREGQDRFRSLVLEAYGSKCAITGFDEVATLQAAHVHPYRGPQFNNVTNGLCLRADIHALFDRGLIAIDEHTNDVLAKPTLMATSYRAVLEGARLRPTKDRIARPSVPALRSHRLWAGL